MRDPRDLTRGQGNHQRAGSLNRENIMAKENAGNLFPVYVWEAPVRLCHWVVALCVAVLAVTGYFIGSPLPSMPGEASDNFLMGYIRFAHFSAAYVFAVFFILRVYWAFVGNKFAREIFLVPRSLFSREWWSGIVNQGLYYAFLKKEAIMYQGHNPAAAASIFFMFVLGTVFMIVTGFALYGEGAGMASWQYKLFSSWVIPLFGQSQSVHTWHHLGMWYLLWFILIHLYLVLRGDIFSGETVVSTMVNGYRVSKH
jgi:Ni/Fe-hydrogenase 1 B-type cytochrome subunit